MELAHDLDIPYDEIRYRSAGINHMAFYLKFEHRQADGTYRDLYPDLVRAYREGRAPKPTWNPRCPNKVRYEMLTRLGYFVTESSEHFAEYTPYFIKEGREDLIEKFGIPLDEYPKRCIEQIAKLEDRRPRSTARPTRSRSSRSKEYASEIVNSVWTGEPGVIYGNVRNNGVITSLPNNAAVEVPCLVDASGIQPTYIGDAAAAADRADPHQYQRAGTDGRGADDREPRAHLPRRDDGPAHRGRARPRADLEPRRRPARRPRRHGCRTGRACRKSSASPDALGQGASALPPSL